MSCTDTPEGCRQCMQLAGNNSDYRTHKINSNNKVHIQQTHKKAQSHKASTFRTMPAKNRIVTSISLCQQQKQSHMWHQFLPNTCGLSYIAMVDTKIIKYTRVF